ncbi:MAG: hypothetical protein Ta2A_18460 [Treponemataceae bacterium]|nr:MAG: hypothetical protein Ta2A_18460 [Treponemataceae bacterium]
MNYKLFYIFRHIYKKMPHSIQNRILEILALFRSFPLGINYLLHDHDKFESELSIAAIVKNEASYIKEWIEYHRLVGVERFYIYDDSSTDNLLLGGGLRPYIESGLVIYGTVLGKWMQVGAYNDAIKKYRNKTKWLAFVDIDEFIVPLSKEKITETLTEIETKISKKIFVLDVHRVDYGYSGFEKKPEGLVIENYTKSDGVEKVYKSIVNPRAVVWMCGAHSTVNLFNMVAINEKGIKIKNECYIQVGKCLSDLSFISCEHIRVNHYRTKSYEEYKQKIGRNLINAYPYHSEYAKTLKIPEFDPEYGSHYDDMVMDKYVPILKSIAKDANNES